MRRIKSPQGMITLAVFSFPMLSKFHKRGRFNSRDQLRAGGGYKTKTARLCAPAAGDDIFEKEAINRFDKGGAPN